MKTDIQIAQENIMAPITTICEKVNIPEEYIIPHGKYIAKVDLKLIAESMGNVLEDVTIKKHPVIEEIKSAMKEAGAMNAMMSGSGPTVFGIFEERETGGGPYETYLFNCFGFLRLR